MGWYKVGGDSRMFAISQLLIGAIGRDGRTNNFVLVRIELPVLKADGSVPQHPYHVLKEGVTLQDIHASRDRASH
jgi:hypothetical protein